MEATIPATGVLFPVMVVTTRVMTTIMVPATAVTALEREITHPATEALFPVAIIPVRAMVITVPVTGVLFPV